MWSSQGARATRTGHFSKTGLPLDTGGVGKRLLSSPYVVLIRNLITIVLCSNRYIEVFRVGPSEMKSMNAMASPRNNNNSNGGGPLRNQMNSNNNRPRPYSYQGRESGNNGRGPFGGGGGGGPSSFRMPTRYFSKGTLVVSIFKN